MTSVAIGMNMIERIDHVRELADFFGFRLGREPHTSYGHGNNIDSIALYPKDERLPCFSRDACLYTGSLGAVEEFLRGIQWARKYDMLIGAATDQRRDQFEKKELARLAKIKYNKEKAATWSILEDAPDDDIPF